MLQYKDYFNKVIEYYNAETEDSFNEIIKSFPKVYEMNWDDYYPDSDDPIKYILEFLINSVDSGAYVDDYSEYNKSVTLNCVDSSKELEDLEEVFNDNGWIIDNYETLKEDIEEEEKQQELEKTKNNLIQEIRNKATLDQLKEFCDSLT